MQIICNELLFNGMVLLWEYDIKNNRAISNQVVYANNNLGLITNLAEACKKLNESIQDQGTTLTITVNEQQNALVIENFDYFIPKLNYTTRPYTPNQHNGSLQGGKPSPSTEPDLRSQVSFFQNGHSRTATRSSRSLTTSESPPAMNGRKSLQKSHSSESNHTPNGTIIDKELFSRVTTESSSNHVVEPNSSATEIVTPNLAMTGEEIFFHATPELDSNHIGEADVSGSKNSFRFSMRKILDRTLSGSTIAYIPLVDSHKKAITTERARPIISTSQLRQIKTLEGIYELTVQKKEQVQIVLDIGEIINSVLQDNTLSSEELKDITTQILQAVTICHSDKVFTVLAQPVDHESFLDVDLSTLSNEELRHIYNSQELEKSRAEVFTRGFSLDHKNFPKYVKEKLQASPELMEQYNQKLKALRAKLVETGCKIRASRNRENQNASSWNITDDNYVLVDSIIDSIVPENLAKERSFLERKSSGSKLKEESHNTADLKAKLKDLIKKSLFELENSTEKKGMSEKSPKLDNNNNNTRQTLKIKSNPNDYFYVNKKYQDSFTEFLYEQFKIRSFKNYKELTKIVDACKVEKLVAHLNEWLEKINQSTAQSNRRSIGM